MSSNDHIIAGQAITSQSNETLCSHCRNTFTSAKAKVCDHCQWQFDRDRATGFLQSRCHTPGCHGIAVIRQVDSERANFGDRFIATCRECSSVKSSDYSAPIKITASQVCWAILGVIACWFFLIVVLGSAQ